MIGREILLKVRRILRSIENWGKNYTIQRRFPSISNNSINKIRFEALYYVNNLEFKNLPHGRYRYKLEDKQPLLYSSVFAALFLHLIGETKKLSSDEREEWTDYINGHQHKDVLYRDPLVANDIAEKEDWRGWRHLTFHALMVLHAQATKSRYSIYFVEKV